ncbi:MAG TPA: DNA recombination protein RmuC [Candidatus Binatia bacterium]|jgi:DNA recombination protein RmuC|nr:DNA recombination protein RmuC [Candidatus Binatia bacterium]
MQNTIFLVVIAAALGVIIYALTSLSRRLQELRDSHTNDKGLIMLNQNLSSMNEKIDKTSETINERLTNAARVISSVQKELGTVQERFKGFEEFNELLHPKMRGNIGEQILADMLGQVFPAEQYGLQHKFKGGETVDAIIKTQAGIIPVDSKFPLENFKQLTRAQTDEERRVATRDFVKAVKKHIDDISKKYLLPEEGTVNFAVMYVPSENVFYQILTDDESALLEYAKGKGVLITSPHAFFSLLRVILMGLERNKLQEQAQKIWDILKGVQQESVRFGETLGVLSRHVTNAKNAMDTAHAGYDKLHGKLDQVKLLE